MKKFEQFREIDPESINDVQAKFLKVDMEFAQLKTSLTQECGLGIETVKVLMAGYSFNVKGTKETQTELVLVGEPRTQFSHAQMAAAKIMSEATHKTVVVQNGERSCSMTDQKSTTSQLSFRQYDLVRCGVGRFLEVS